MKKFYYLILLITTFSFSQTPEMKAADELADAGKYIEEIELRKLILNQISDKDSEVYKTQAYKLKLAEFHTADDLEIALEKISEAERIFNSLDEQDPFVKIDIGINYYETVSNMGNVEEGKTKLLEVYDFTLQQESSEKRSEELAYIYTNLGRVFLYYNDYEQSLSFLDQALELNEELYGYNSLETAAVLKELGIVYSYTGNTAEVLAYHDKALDIYETLQPKDRYILFKQYASNFQAYKYYGDVKKVEALYGKLSDFYNTHKHDPSFINMKQSEFFVLSPIASTYSFVQLQMATAFEKPDEAEEIISKFRDSHKGKAGFSGYEMNLIISHYLETGSMFHNLENKSNIDNYYKARKYYYEAVAFGKEIGNVFGELQGYMMLSILGVDYQQWEDVIKYSNLALEHPNIEIFNQTQTLKHNLGLAYGTMKEYDSMFEIFDEEYEYYYETNEKSYYSLQNLIESGDLYLELYEEDPREDLLEKAYKNFYLASEIFSGLYRGGEFSLRLHTYSSQINNGLLLSSIRLGKHEAEVAERLEINTSDYLWSSFLSNRKEPFSETTQQLQHQIDSLKMQQDLLAIQISSDSIDSSQLSELRNELKATEKTFKDKSRELKKSDNSFYQFSRTDFDIKKFQKKIKPNEYVVKYIMTDVSAFAFVIGQNSVNLIQLEGDGPVIKEKVASYLASLKTAKPEFISGAQALYSELISPLALAENAQLIIVPDGFLANFPFETLMTPEGNYLMENHTVSYAYSIKLFDIQNAIKKNAKDRLAAFSPSYNLDFAMNSNKEDLQILVRSGNYELAGAETESKYVSSIFSGDLFSGDAATKSNFIDKSSHYKMLHLAMHAIVDEDEPEQSNLIFQNDERLYMDELYELKIPADLAVLSACNTGSGELKDGEGVQSLSRAFTYAGVKSTVMSLWPVPDKQTSMIMTHFYKQLKAGKAKNEALQLAKINYLNTVTEVELKHPFYWAGFVISGDVSPLDTPNSYGWYFAFGALIILSLLFYINRRKTKA